LDNSLTGDDVLTGKKDFSKRLCNIGGGMVGLEVAEYLVRREHQVTVVELLDDIARDMEPITRNLTVKELTNSGVEILTSLGRVTDWRIGPAIRRRGNA
jgi:pyruvate/2-oxoglutarate dehydrogenase complex dihydrolipoamide dehydrogenase (E3) component